MNTVVKISLVVFLGLFLLSSEASGQPDGNNSLLPATLEEPWRSLILTDPLMLLGEGAVFQPLDSKNWVLMGVGTCAIKSGDVEDRLRCLRVAQSRASRAVTKLLNGFSLESWTEVSTKLTITTNNSNDTTFLEDGVFEYIRQQALGLVDGLPIIAMWNQENERLFCIVLGTVKTILP